MSDPNAFQGRTKAAALTTPVETLISFPMISQIEKPILGALLYVGATPLLPPAEHEPGKYSLVALVGGILVTVGIVVNKS